ncbi:ABC transporter substrate-binding protein [Bacilliculturomica massiliensis]|uniref:ABC transporter substrate-binding protein n=1 Tax=Bacilliculturomica massiliensis TaxID=1917867 RepID=UPI0013EF0DAA|nr:ABC transporter substrate-binding protein [Bacilliculturomica massiliensis]
MNIKVGSGGRKSRRMGPVLLLLAVMMAALPMLAGCASGQDGTDSPGQSGGAAETAGGSGEVRTLRVAMLGKDIKTACVILADELGYFEEEGVNVEFEKVSSLADALTAVSTGKLDVLPYGVIPSCSFISQGTDVVIFGGTISEGSEAIVKPENKDAFRSPEDFRGKRIGCFRMETGHMVMKGVLREAGLDVDRDVSFIYLDSSASIMEAVMKGEVDVGFVNSGYGYIAEQSGAAVAFAVGDLVPDFPCCRQTASAEALADKRDALVKFETALLRALDVYRNDRTTTVEKLTAYSGQDAAYVEAIMYGGGGYDNAMIVSLDPNKNKVEDFYEVMKANGDIDAGTPYDIADYIDTSVYADALDILIDRGEGGGLYEELKDEYGRNNS